MRLQKVIFVDLFARLRVHSIKEVKQKFNKLSDWIDLNSTSNKENELNSIDKLLSS